MRPRQDISLIHQLRDPCQFVFPANSCQNTSLVIDIYCKYLFTVVFFFNQWLSTFLSNVRMGSKPQKSLCELHGICCSLKEDKVTGYTALIYITCQRLFILGQSRVSRVVACYLWSSYRSTLALGRVALTLAKCGFSSPKRKCWKFSTSGVLDSVRSIS